MNEGNGLRGVHLDIHLRPDGGVQVSGPLPDKILCLGMLKLAEQAILDFKPAVILPRVQ